MSACNGAFAVLRPDAWVVDAWGQATDLPNGGATADSVDAIEFFTSDSSGNGYLQTGNLAVAIERAWVTDHYQIRVLISNDTAWYSFTLKEPTTNGNTMTLVYDADRVWDLAKGIASVASKFMDSNLLTIFVKTHFDVNYGRMAPVCCAAYWALSSQ